MRSHRRWLPVLAIMTLAMVLCAVVTQLVLTESAPPPFLRVQRQTANVLLNGIGLLFALHAGAALLVTRRWHRVAVSPPAALRALVSSGLSFPVLFWGAMVLTCLVVGALPTKNARGEDCAFLVVGYAATVAASAAGARWVAAVLARLTGAIDRPLRSAMVAYGAVWPFVQPLAKRLSDNRAFDWLFHEAIGAGPLFAWQLPVGLAVAAWFVRRGPAPAGR